MSAVNDELLSAVGKLTAEYGKIGGNLNQIARYLNEYGVPYNALSGEVRAAIDVYKRQVRDRRDRRRDLMKPKRKRLLSIKH